MTITPDGRFYLAMREGYIVPRPYSLRLVAKYVEDWGAFTDVSYGLFAIAGWLWVFFLTGDYVTAIATTMLAVMLPTIRRFRDWPVLLDAPMMALSVIIGLLFYIWPPLGIVGMVASTYVHERTPIYGALMAWPVCHDPVAIGVGIGLSTALTLYRYLRLPRVPMEEQVVWLANPLRAALANHRKALHPDVWLWPWGGLLVGLAGMDWYLAMVLMVSYGGCIVGMDRMRIYQSVPYPLALYAVTVTPWWLWPILILITWRTRTGEV